MKIVYFTKYSRLGASSRLRSFQFESYYQMNQMEVSYFSLFDDEYLLKLYHCLGRFIRNRHRRLPIIDLHQYGVFILMAAL